MVNPAFGLAKIFEGWRLKAKVGPAQARAHYAEEIGVREPEVVRLGMGHLVDIGSRISDLKARGLDVSPFEWGLPHWQAAFVAAASAANNAPATPTRYPISDDRLYALKSFGLFLDAHAAGLQPRPEFVAGIEEAIDEAWEFVGNADIAEETRHYLLALLARIRSAVREGRPFEMREAVNEFVGATVVAESTLDPEQRKGWAEIRKTLLTPVLAGAGGNLLSQGVGVVAGLIGNL